jgi:serine/threonine protein kinase
MQTLLELKKFIGKGTMGSVYLSRLPNSDKDYATKKIDKKNADRPGVHKYLETEMLILRKLKHKNIVALGNIKQTNSHYYFTMEYCNGGSLLNCLLKYKSENQRPFPEDIVQYLMRQIVDGLKFIHQNDIIHRDIKLANILVKFNSDEDIQKLNMKNAIIKICDFGISVDGDRGFTTIGAPAYMDPILLKKLQDKNLKTLGYDKSVDIWSLGIACYEMLTGRKAFVGKDLNDLYQKVEKGNYTIPTNLSKEVVSFIKGMLQYDPGKRMTIEELSNHEFLTKDVNKFHKINLELYASKLTTSGIKINTKNNNDLQLSTINALLNLIPEELTNSNKIEVPQFPNNSQYKINNLNNNYNNSNIGSTNNNINIINNGNFNNNINVNAIKYYSDKQIKHINTKLYNRNNMINNNIKMNTINYRNNQLAQNYKPLSIKKFNTNINKFNFNTQFANSVDIIPYQLNKYNP